MEYVDYGKIDFEIKKEQDFQFVEEGEGHKLLLLHGLFGALSNFRDVIDYFSSKNYKVIVPLLPIYSLPVLDTSVKNLAKFVNEFVTFKEYQDFTLIGNSLGGHVGLVYSLDFPDKVHSMVLTGSSGLYENSFGEGYPRKGDKNYLREKIKITFYDQKHVTDELVDECYSVVNDRNKLIRILAFAKSAIRHNLAKNLPDINIPTCLIWGRNDQITPADVAEEFDKILPDSNLYWIDQCGHAPMMERPTEFNILLDQWLEKLFAEKR